MPAGCWGLDENGGVSSWTELLLDRIVTIKQGGAMVHQGYIRKRPCSICRTPHPRLKDRQRTCGDPECKKEWHRKRCAEWNRRNRDYFKTNYLQKKVDAESTAQIKSRFKTGLPKEYVQDVIGPQLLVIMEYLAQLMVQRFQEVIQRQLSVNTRKTQRLPYDGFSRFDGL